MNDLFVLYSMLALYFQTKLHGCHWIYLHLSHRCLWTTCRIQLTHFANCPRTLEKVSRNSDNERIQSRQFYGTCKEDQVEKCLIIYFYGAKEYHRSDVFRIQYTCKNSSNKYIGKNKSLSCSQFCYQADGGTKNGKLNRLKDKIDSVTRK